MSLQFNQAAFSTESSAGVVEAKPVETKHVETCGCPACASASEGAGDGLSGLTGDKPIWSFDQIVANFLDSDKLAPAASREDNPGVADRAWARGATIVYSFREALPPGADAGAEFIAFTDIERAMTRLAFDLVSDVTGLIFVEAPDDGAKTGDTDRIYFGKDSALPDFEWGHARNYLYRRPGTDQLAGGEIWLNADNVAGRGWFAGGYNFQALTHEILHAIGMPHPGEYNANSDDPIKYGTHAQYAQDTRQFTIMSYFSAENSGADYGTDGPGGGLWSGATPLLHDVAALQAVYGANTGTRAGDTVYGYNSTAGRSVYDFAAWFQPTSTPSGAFINPAPIFTIWDGGGNDTLDFSRTVLAVNLDLNAGAFSDSFGMTNNISIAYGVVIENGIGGAANDRLVGNAANNVLNGGGGDDVLLGGFGDDILLGGAGADVFIFERGSGADVIVDFSAGLGLGDVIDLKGVSGFGDFNGLMSRAVQVGADTRIDLSGGDSIVLRNVSRGALSADDFLLSGSPAASKSLTNDFSGDGEADLMWRHESGQLHLWRSAAGETYGSQNLGEVDPAWSIQELADFTGDARADVLWRGPGGQVHLWRSAKDGGFSGVQDLGFVDPAWRIVDGADFTGDGKADIVWRGPAGQLHVWRSSPDGFSGVQDLGTIGLDWTTQESADFNGDGKADLLWRHSSGALHVWNSTSNGFSSTALGDIPMSWQVQQTADFNADGKADILWRNDAGQVHLWRSGPSGFSTVDLGLVPLDWTIEEADDYNGDGRADIVWRQDGGSTHLWLTRADGGYSSVEIGQVPLDWDLVV